MHYAEVGNIPGCRRIGKIIYQQYEAYQEGQMGTNLLFKCHDLTFVTTIEQIQSTQYTCPKFPLPLPRPLLGPPWPREALNGGLGLTLMTEPSLMMTFSSGSTATGGTGPSLRASLMVGRSDMPVLLRDQKIFCEI